MQLTNTKVVISFPRKTGAGAPDVPANDSNPPALSIAGPIDDRVPDDLAAFALGDARVQIRVPLETLEQAEAALILMQSAIEKSLTQVRAARRRRDTTALLAVRQLLQAANRHINCRRRGR